MNVLLCFCYFMVYFDIIACLVEFSLCCGIFLDGSLCTLLLSVCRLYLIICFFGAIIFFIVIFFIVISHLFMR